MIASANVDARAGAWYRLSVRVRGDRMTVSLDGKQQIDARDARFSAPGGVGFWTKADATTDFDDLVIEP
ncbi:MAG: hypothetical protein Fur0037_05150 [Planctomycetota bacterium]